MEIDGILQDIAPDAEYPGSMPALPALSMQASAMPMPAP
jgi:hypothetical protein